MMPEKLTEKLIDLVQKVKDSIQGKQTFADFLQNFCEDLSACLDAPMVWISLREEDGAVRCCARAGEISKHIDISNIPISKIISFPIVCCQEQVIGTLSIYVRDLSCYDQQQINIVEAMVIQLALLAEIERGRESLWLEREKALITLNAMREAVITTNILSEIEYMNPIAEELTGWKLEQAKGLSLFNVFSVEDKEVDPYNSLARFYGRRTPAFVTQRILVNRNGNRIMIEDSTSPIRDRDNNKIVGAVLVFHDITEKYNLLGRLSFLASYDTLSGLPNRSVFSKVLNEIIEAKPAPKPFAVFFFDIDRFKFINDSFGHNVGDILIIEVAKEIKSQVRENDLLCRFGGDEFALIVNKMSDSEVLSDLASRIIKACSKKYIIGKNEIYISISIGIAVYPYHGQDADAILKHADMAMYSAKRKGGNQFQIFISEEDTKPFKRFSLLGLLNEALAKSEFELHYQPQIDLLNGTVSGLEALIRWHSSQGLIPPADFIPLAEETGLIIPIGEWVLREACEQNKDWQRRYKPLQVAVNISAKQFYQKDFIGSVKKILSETRLEPHWLILELTESIAMQNISFTANAIAELNSIGVKIAIDDFGTGYSSLNYLASLPIDYLKIDKSFLRNMKKQNKNINVASAIINLGNNLGIEVIAEGVEEPEQMDFLKDKGCPKAQGFLIGKPLPARDIVKVLTEKDR